MSEHLLTALHTLTREGYVVTFRAQMTDPPGRKMDVLTVQMAFADENGNRYSHGRMVSGGLLDDPDADLDAIAQDVLREERFKIEEMRSKYE